MCKNVPVVQINMSSGNFTVLNGNLLPFALRGSVNNFPFALASWISNRVLSLSRTNAKKLLNALNLSQTDRVAMCFACKGLSLTDSFWFRTEDSADTWESVNLFSNSLSSSVAKIALTGEYISIQGRVRTPEITGMGSYAKSWRRLKDGIYLYKAGSDLGVDESKIEILCSDILDRLGVNHVKYEFAQTGLRKVSRCKNMCNEDLSICEMDEFQGYCNRNGIDVNNWLINQQGYYEMLIADYLLYNTDRHGGNWGIHFSSVTGKVIGLHPLYDHNNSLVITGDEHSLVIAGKSRLECAMFAKYRCTVNISALVKWLNTSGVKKRFKSIFNGLSEYNELLNRIKVYNSF